MPKIIIQNLIINTDQSSEKIRHFDPLHNSVSEHSKDSTRIENRWIYLVFKNNKFIAEDSGERRGYLNFHLGNDAYIKFENNVFENVDANLVINQRGASFLELENNNAKNTHISIKDRKGDSFTVDSSGIWKINNETLEKKYKKIFEEYN